MVSGRRELVIPVSFGDLYQVFEALRCTVKERDLSMLTTTLWVMREHHRRGTWRPFTFGRYVVLRRARVWWAMEPSLRGEYPWWRHSDHPATRRRQEKP